MIQRHLLREHGIVVAGPEIRDLIDPVSPDDLRGAVRGVLSAFWAKQIDDTAWLSPPEYQAFAILTMCRAMHALAHGTIVSKPAAAAWAQKAFDPIWRETISAALAFRPGLPLDRLDESVALIRYVLERVRA